MLKRSSVALAFGAAVFGSALFADPQIEVLSRIIWEPDVGNFGGLSALEIDDAGTSFIAVSDTGVLYRGALKRASDGRLRDATLKTVRPLLFENGQRPELKQHRDTEGLAMISPDDLHITAESKTRLLRYENDESTPKISALPPRDPQTPSNMGFEALAISKRGTLVTIPEGSPNIRAPFDVYERDTNGTWSVIYKLPRHGGFRPVGADFGPDGHLYILSRAFNGLGFSTRIGRLNFDDGEPTLYEPIFRSFFRQFDNLEGLAVWKAGPNDLRLVAISDDNFSAAQRTELVEFRLKE